MVLLVSNGIIPLENRCIYVVDDILVIESEIAARTVTNFPEDAISQIAMGFAENKAYVEFEDASLVLEDNDEA